jgi:hypothetical protein
MRIALRSAMYGVLASLVYLFVGGPEVAPCLGGPGFDNAPCVATWLSERPWQAWLLSTPYPEIAGFLVASALTVWWSRRQRRVG